MGVTCICLLNTIRSLSAVIQIPLAALESSKQLEQSVTSSTKSMAGHDVYSGKHNAISQPLPLLLLIYFIKCGMLRLCTFDGDLLSRCGPQRRYTAKNEKCTFSLKQTETYLDQFHGLFVDVSERSVTIHLQMPESANALVITDEPFFRHLDKLLLLFEMADDLYTLIQEPLVSLVENGFRVINPARGFGSIKYPCKQGLSGAFKPQYRLDPAALESCQHSHVCILLQRSI